MHGRDSPEDSFLSTGDDISFPRPQYPSSVPASVPSGNPQLWSDAPRRSEGNEEETDPNNQNHDHTLEYPMGPVEASVATDQARVEVGDEQSPLSTLSQIQNALPEIAGQGFSNN